MQASSSDEDGVTVDELGRSIKKVRGKINIIKNRHLLNSKRRAKSRIKNLSKMTEEMKMKGIDVNEKSLATRVKNPMRISTIEANVDKKFKEMMGSDDDDEVMDDDKELQNKEGEERGRKGKENAKKKKLLGKRIGDTKSDMQMDSSDDDD